MTQSQPTSAVLYAAKSTDDPRGSIKTQLQDSRAMSEREGWSIVGEYQDEAASAWSGNRGARSIRGSRVELAERLAPSVVVVQHSDRLARGDARQAQHLVEIVLWAVKSGVTIRSVQDDHFAEESTSLLMGALMGQRNTEDSKRKSLAVKAGVPRRIEQGKPTGGRAPHGGPTGTERLEVVGRRPGTSAASTRSTSQGAHNSRSPGAWSRTELPTKAGGPGTREPCGDVGEPDLQGLRHPPRARPSGPRADHRSGDLGQGGALRDAQRRSRGGLEVAGGQRLLRKGSLKCGRCGGSMVPRTERTGSRLQVRCYRCYQRLRDPSPARCLRLSGHPSTPLSRVLPHGGAGSRGNPEGSRGVQGRRLQEVRQLPHGRGAHRDGSRRRAQPGEARLLSGEISARMERAKGRARGGPSQCCGPDSGAQGPGVRDRGVDRASGRRS